MFIYNGIMFSLKRVKSLAESGKLLETILLSELSQSLKDKHVFSHLWLIDFIQTHKITLCIHDIKVEAKLSRVTKGTNRKDGGQKGMIEGLGRYAQHNNNCVYARMHTHTKSFKSKFLFDCETVWRGGVRHRSAPTGRTCFVSLLNKSTSC